MFVAQHKAQHVLDKMWMDTVERALSDHAKKVDTNDSGLLHLDKKIDNVEMGYDHCQTNITMLKSDHETLRNDLIKSNGMIDKNDKNLKDIIDANDLAVKTTVGDANEKLKAQMQHVTSWLAQRDKDSQSLTQRVDMLQSQLQAGITAPTSVTTGDELMASLMNKVNALSTRVSEMDLSARSAHANTEQRQVLIEHEIRSLHVEIAAAAAPTHTHTCPHQLRHLRPPRPSPQRSRRRWA